MRTLESAWAGMSYGRLLLVGRLFFTCLLVPYWAGSWRASALFSSSILRGAHGSAVPNP